ncbi:hypothetical protein HHI36_007954 [Cryptolaemus montrouzieri]|uniref:Uncharacterized protein n=1 Tax=Cryptolaemus montrouzieri TaxID=559131 RepID=A0ABD2MRL9_9CUCU
MPDQTRSSDAIRQLIIINYPFKVKKSLNSCPPRRIPWTIWKLDDKKGKLNKPELTTYIEAVSLTMAKKKELNEKQNKRKKKCEHQQRNAERNWRKKREKYARRKK